VAYLFNLWNLFWTSADTCEFDISPANMPRVKDGGAEFVAACLNAFGIDIQPRSWEITPSRCYYLSEYISPSDPWQDRWGIAWSVRVKLVVPSARVRHHLSGVPVTMDAPDLTWRYDDEDPRYDSTALIISVHKGQRQRVETLERMLGESATQSNKYIPAVFTALHDYSAHLFELRMLVRNISFPDWVESADRLTSMCREHDGTVNFRKLLLTLDDATTGIAEQG
jgi:hypothetical protein